MIEIRYVKLEDKDFWYSLDKHLPKDEFEKKVRDKRGYVLLEEGKPVALLRYNLFWDIFYKPSGRAVFYICFRGIQ